MATVSTETIYCFHKEFKRVVRYKSRYGKFYITLPSGVPQQEVESDTEGGAIKLFDAAVEVYEKSVTEKTKVILYGYQVDACIYDTNDKQGQTRIIFDSMDGSECDFGSCFSEDGISLKLWVAGYEKSEVVLEGVDNYIDYSQVESTIPKSLEPTSGPSTHRYGKPDFQEIPWTPENEQFFTDIGVAFEQLILKLNSVLGSKKGVLDFIESGKKLLPE